LQTRTTGTALQDRFASSQGVIRDRERLKAGAWEDQSEQVWIVMPEDDQPELAGCDLQGLREVSGTDAWQVHGAAFNLAYGIVGQANGRGKFRLGHPKFVPKLAHVSPNTAT
jgi:hypothetical protein